MPCVVPNCDPKGQCFALHFPKSYMLSQRWRQAIELGSGEALPEDFVSALPEAEVCQQHFCEFDEYGEPVIFWNESQDREIRLSSCRLCLKFTLPTETISNWQDLTLGNRTVRQLLKNVLQIECDDSECLDSDICQNCLVRLDMLATISGQISNDSKVWTKLQGLSKYERRVWDKISGGVKGSSIEERPSSSDAILLQVELESEQAIGDATDSVFIIESENEKMQMLDERTDEELVETHEGSNDSERNPELNESIALKISEKRKASDRKADQRNRPEKRKYRKRERPPTQPKMHLKVLKNRKCYLCSVVYDSADELMDHLLSHSDEDMVCGHCGYRFSSLLSYNRHLAKHDPTERPLQCNHCNLRYKDNKVLRVHEEMVHLVDHGGVSKKPKSNKTFTCQFCGQTFSALQRLQSHEDMHTGNKRFKCTQCDTAFRDRMNLERHCMRKHTSVKPFKCEICASVYRISTSYEEHRKSCNPEVLRDIIENGTTCNTCRFCSDEFPKHSDLVDHTIQFHSNEKVHFFRCYLCKCKVRFVEKYDYAVHMQRHLDAKSRGPLKCRHCPELFNSRQECKAHEASSHEGAGRNAGSCQHCSRTFADARNLARHERLHTGLKPYQCEVCGKSFATAEQLRTHLRIHAGERPFECELCGKRFSDRSTLYRHRKNVCKKSVICR